MNMNINIAYITWLRSWLRSWLRNWKSCPLASLAPAMADLRPWNHLGSDPTMDLHGLCSHLEIIMCCFHIYMRERYRTNKYPNLRRTAPNIWMPAFSWTKGKQPHQTYHDFHCRNPWIGLLPEDLRWNEYFIALQWHPGNHQNVVLGEEHRKNGHRLKSLEQGHLGLELV